MQAISNHKKDVQPSEMTLDWCVDVVRTCGKRLSTICILANTPIDHVSVANDAYEKLQTQLWGKNGQRYGTGAGDVSGGDLYSFNPHTAGGLSSTSMSGAVGGQQRRSVSNTSPTTSSPAGGLNVSQKEKRLILRVEAARAMLQEVSLYIQLRLAEEADGRANGAHTHNNRDYLLYKAVGTMHHWLLADETLPAETREQQRLMQQDDANSGGSGVGRSQKSIAALLVDKREVPRYSYGALLQLISETEVGLLSKEFFPFEALTEPTQARLMSDAKRGEAPEYFPSPKAEGIEGCDALNAALTPPPLPELPADSNNSPNGGNASTTPSRVRSSSQQPDFASPNNRRSPSSGGAMLSPSELLTPSFNHQLQAHIREIFKVWAQAMTTYFLHCEVLDDMERQRRKREQAEATARAAAEEEERLRIERERAIRLKEEEEERLRMERERIIRQQQQQAEAEEEERRRRQRQRELEEEEERKRQDEAENVRRMKKAAEDRRRREEEAAEALRLQLRKQRIEDEAAAERERLEQEAAETTRRKAARAAADAEAEERRRRDRQRELDEQDEAHRHALAAAARRRNEELEALEAERLRLADEKRSVEAMRRQHAMTKEQLSAEEEAARRRAAALAAQIKQQEDAARAEADRLRRVAEEAERRRIEAEAEAQRQAEEEESHNRRRKAAFVRKQRVDDLLTGVEIDEEPADRSRLAAEESSDRQWLATLEGQEHRAAAAREREAKARFEEDELRKRQRALDQAEERMRYRVARQRAEEAERAQREEEARQQLAAQFAEDRLNLEDGEERSERYNVTETEKSARLYLSDSEYAARQKALLRERTRRQAEDAAARKAKEEELLRKAREAELKRQKEEEELRRREEELRRLQEEADRKMREAEERRRAAEAEAEAERQRKAAEEEAERQRKAAEEEAEEAARQQQQQQSRNKAARPMLIAHRGDDSDDDEADDDLRRRVEALERENRYLCQMVDGISTNHVKLHRHVLETEEHRQHQITTTTMSSYSNRSSQHRGDSLPLIRSSSQQQPNNNSNNNPTHVVCNDDDDDDFEVDASGYHRRNKAVRSNNSSNGRRVSKSIDPMYAEDLPLPKTEELAVPRRSGNTTPRRYGDDGKQANPNISPFGAQHRYDDDNAPTTPSRNYLQQQVVSPIAPNRSSVGPSSVAAATASSAHRYNSVADRIRHEVATARPATAAAVRGVHGANSTVTTTTTTTATTSYSVASRQQGIPSAPAVAAAVGGGGALPNRQSEQRLTAEQRNAERDQQRKIEQLYRGGGNAGTNNGGGTTTATKTVTISTTPMEPQRPSTAGPSRSNFGGGGGGTSSGGGSSSPPYNSGPRAYGGPSAGLGGWNMYDDGGFSGAVGYVYDPRELDAPYLVIAANAPAWMHPKALQQAREDHLRQIQRAMYGDALSASVHAAHGGGGAEGLSPSAFEHLLTPEELAQVQERQRYEVRVVQQILREIRSRGGLEPLYESDNANANNNGGATVGILKGGGGSSGINSTNNKLLALLPEPLVKLDLSTMTPWINDTHLLLILSTLLETAKHLPENAKKDGRNVLTMGNANSSSSISGLNSSRPTSAHYASASMYPRGTTNATNGCANVDGLVANVAATVRSIDISKCANVSSDTVLLVLSDLVRLCPNLGAVNFSHDRFDPPHYPNDSSSSGMNRSSGGGGPNSSVTFSTSPVKGHDSYPSSPNMRNSHINKVAEDSAAAKNALTVLEDALAERAIAAQRRY